MKKTERLEIRISKKDKESLYKLAKEKGISVSEYILSKTLKEDIDNNHISKLREYQEYVNALIKEDCAEEITEKERQEYRKYMTKYLPRVIRAIEEELSSYTVSRIKKASERYERNIYKLREFKKVVESEGHSMYELYIRDNNNTYGHRTCIDDIIEVIDYIEGKGLKYL